MCIVCVVVRAHGASAAALSGVSSASGFGLPAGSLALRARPRGPAGGPRTPRVQGIQYLGGSSEGCQGLRLVAWTIINGYIGRFGRYKFLNYYV